MKFLALLLILVSVVACTDDLLQLSQDEVQAIDKVFKSANQSPEMMEKWARSCALCHINGEGGAPRMGDTEAWQPRLEQGKAVLYTHTIKGFNRMPPLGYCMDCHAEDYAAMINLLVGEAN